MTLESWKYGNPETVAIKKQEYQLRQLAACGSCINRVTLKYQGEELNGCKFKSRNYGTRCNLFEVKKP